MIVPFLLTQHQLLLESLESYKAYEAYLQSVIDILPPDYLETTEPQVSDVLARYQTSDMKLYIVTCFST